jgi:acetate kinase
MNILVFNVGSSSIKTALFEKNIEIKTDYFEHVTTQVQRKKVISKITKNNANIDAIGHRVVHGGMLFDCKITPKTMQQIADVAKLAPLHDIPELEVIRACAKEFKCPQYAIFDTTFHQTLPDKVKTYAIPKAFQKKGVHKYGFHGISHEYISKGLKDKVITCHLGSGCSLAAIKNGKSIDTTMGFTPLDGIMMGTRPGSIDPGVILYLQKQGVSVSKVEHALNYESGWKAIAGTTDFLTILKSKDAKCKLAVDMFVHSVITNIGAMVASLNGVDTIVFAGGVGERNPEVRKRICNGLEFLGVSLDLNLNKKTIESKGTISSKKSKVDIIVIPTNEAMAINKKVQKLS